MTFGKEQYVKSIAKDTYLREDVVEDVIDRFLDIAIEQIVNEGELKIHRLLSVSSSDYKGYSAGKGEVKPHKRLKVSLSAGIHKLFKHKNNGGEPTVTRDNWQAVLARITEPKPAAKKEEASGLYNPLLDDD